MRHSPPARFLLLPFLVLGLAACGGRNGDGGTDMGSTPDGSSMTDSGTDAGSTDAGTDLGSPDLSLPDLGEPCGAGLFCGNGSYCCNSCCLPNTMPICLPGSCDHVDGGPRPDGGPSHDGGGTPDGSAFDGGHSGSSCGGFGGGVCGRGQFCSYGIGADCGFTDATGTCEAIPSGCTGPAMPVCGCDGNDYDSECLANASGTSVQHGGTCGGIDPPPPPPIDAGPSRDCRVTGCPSGEHCDLCWTSWACLPAGAVC